MFAGLKQRARTELDIVDLTVFPLMPTPDEEGVPSVRPLTTSEASKWLNVVLVQQASKLAVGIPLKYTLNVLVSFVF